MRTTRVFIADDHEGYRGGMARLIGDHPGLELVGEAADGDEALRGVVELQPDVALLAKETPPLAICAELVAAGEGRVGWSIE